MLICAAWPPVRTAEIPGKRVSASAIDTSGSPPRSSADICSETVSEKRFWFNDWIKLVLKPRTSIRSRVSSCGRSTSSIEVSGDSWA